MKQNRKKQNRFLLTVLLPALLALLFFAAAPDARAAEAEAAESTAAFAAVYQLEASADRVTLQPLNGKGTAVSSGRGVLREEAVSDIYPGAEKLKVSLTGMESGSLCSLMVLQADDTAAEWDPDALAGDLVYIEENIADSSGVSFTVYTELTAGARYTLWYSEMGRAAEAIGSFAYDTEFFALQIERIVIRPTDLPAEDLTDSAYKGVDADGNLTEKVADAAGFALYVDPAETDRFYTLTAEGFYKGTSLGDVTEELTWASENTALAAVKYSDGTAALTVKAKAAGAGSVTATAKDGGAACGTFAVYSRDYEPRIETAKLTMDTQKAGSAQITAVESYGNTINAITVYEKNSKTKAYEPTDRFTAVFTAEPEEVITLSAAEALANGNYSLQLQLQCADGSVYSHNLAVTVKNTTPTVTLKQGSFNLFYADSSSEIAIAAKNAVITDVAVVSEDFSGSYDPERSVLTMRFAEGRASAAPTVKFSLKIYCEGYANPIVKALTLTAKTVKPKLAAASGTLTLNRNLGEAATQCIPLLVGGEPYEFKPETLLTDNAAWGDAAASGSEGMVITLLPDEKGSCSGGTMKFTLQDPNWTSALTASLTIKLSDSAPTAKLSLSTLSLNRLLPDRTASAVLTISQNNVLPEEVTVAPVGTAAEGKIHLTYENGVLTAALADETVPAGSYSYLVTPVVNGSALKSASLTVRVQETAVKLTASAGTIKLNKTFTARAASLWLTPNTALDPDEILCSEITVTSNSKAGSIAYERAQKIRWQAEADENGRILLTATEEEPIAVGSYSFTIKVPLRVGGVESSSTAKVTVKVENSLPKVTFAAASKTMNLLYAGSETAEYTPSLNSADYALEGFREIEDGSWACESAVDLRFEDGLVLARLTDAAQSGKTYKISLTPLVTDLTTGQSGLELAQVTLSVKTVNKQPTVKLSTSGKLDLLQRGSGITVTVTGINNSAAQAESAALLQYEEFFTLTPLADNAKGQKCFLLQLKEEAEVSTKTTYAIPIAFTLNCGETDGAQAAVLTSTLKVKPTQTTLKLKATPSTQTVYQSQSRSRELIYTVEASSPAGAIFTAEQVSIGDIRLWQRSLVKEADNIRITPSADGTRLQVSVTIKDTSSLTAGKSYTLPLLITAKGAADGTSATRINLTLKAQK